MRNSLKSGLALLFIITASSIAAKYFFIKKNTADVVVRHQAFQAETVSSPADREKGLGGRDSLCENCAMLFVFPLEGKYAFHMKSMEFDLDIIWISGGKIAYIARNIPHSFKETVDSPVPADMVLEINAGLSDKYHFQEGDDVKVN
ncbi:MAG: hypothetical protein A2259_00345 [Candidatus Moranbacteria bacterium RIFOXYA2_FULL_43_15]|nr:MAG: hypothetical protein A2259_00345 [Candidatus Moranbacteria bacterium RIFOXYA2_FULL_43_15]